MKRSIIVLLAAAVALGGCSGKAEEAPATPAPAKQADGAKPHVNPWAMDAPDAATK